MKQNNVRKANSNDVSRLAPALAKAFDEDPFVNWLVRSDNNRRKGIELLFKTGLTMLSLPFGEVLTTDDCIGGALWIPSDNVKISILKQISMVPAITGIASFSGLLRVIGCLDALDKAHPQEKHYYLFFVGVDPSQRKKGIGSTLIEPVLEKCDREGCGAYLENTNLANQAFYESHGFEVTGDLIVGKNAPPLKAMWRKPKF